WGGAAGRRGRATLPARGAPPRLARAHGHRLRPVRAASVGPSALTSGPGYSLRYNAAGMRRALTLSLLGIAIVASGCGGDEREWMELNEKYTREDFKRRWAGASPQ